MHYMSVKQRYFNLLKDGKKTIELRLFDEKRQKIKMGDYILFSNADNLQDSFQGKVINLHWDKNFDALCKKINPKQAGFQTKKELLCALNEFYSDEEQEKFGVVGIEVNTKIND